MNIPQTILADCTAEALRTYPNEGCGFLIGTASGEATRFIPVENIQDALHERDPIRFPRTAKTAYMMDPRRQEAIFVEAEKAGDRVLAIVHSHPDHDAYFSAEDRAMAAPWGEPLLPGLAYIVISVYKGAVKEVKIYSWDKPSADFAETPLGS